MDPQNAGQTSAFPGCTLRGESGSSNTIRYEDIIEDVTLTSDRDNAMPPIVALLLRDHQLEHEAEETETGDCGQFLLNYP